MPKYNLGYKMKQPVEVPSGENENKVHYPSISISTKDVEGLELKSGQKVKLIGVVVGIDERKRDDEKKETRYDIDIEQLNKGYSEEEYMNLPDEKKDDADAKDLEEKAEKKEE